MICIGLISVQKKKKKSFKKWLGHFETEELCKSEINIIQSKISLTEDEMNILPLWYKNFILKRLKKKLYKSGATIIVNETEGANNEVILPLSYENLLKATLLFQNKLNFTIGNILDKEMKNLDYSFLKVLCLNTKYINIYTSKTEVANELSSRIYDSYGVFPEIHQYEENIKNKNSLIIDLDKKFIRFGRDIYIDGIMLGMDLFDIKIDLDKLLEELPEIKQYLSFKSWMSGKNKLTMTAS